MSDTTTDSAEPESAPATGVRVRIFGRTDVGMVREHNEDNFLIADLSQNLRTLKPEVRTHTVGPRGTLFAVCDGMGGAAAGEVASQMAVDTIYDLIQNAPAPENRDQFAARLSAAINEAGARIFLAAKANRAQRGMGTTSTVAGVYGRTLFLGQVGDSRAYLLRKSRFKQLTKDQSLVWKLIEAGQITEAEAESYEHSHIILQALGTADTVSVDLSYIELCKGDAILVCSDGLSGLVTADQMREVLLTTDEPMDACKRLTDLANQAGGHDNVTVIVARFDGDVPEPTEEDEQFGYRGYVMENAAELVASPRASGKIKGADAPPPGKDVKYATSIRPPPMNGQAPEPMKPATPPVGGASSSTARIAGADDDIELPVSNTPRLVLGAVLVGLAVALAGTAYMMLHRAPPEPPPASAPHATPVPPAPVAPAAPTAAPGSPDPAAPTPAPPSASTAPTTPSAPSAGGTPIVAPAGWTVEAGVPSASAADSGAEAAH